MGPNRRRFMRVHPSVLATRVAARDLREAGILVENISLGGAFLRTATPLPLGEMLSLEMAPPGQDKLVKVHGRVVSTMQQDRAIAEAKAPGMGVSFGALDDTTRELLRSLIRSFVPDGTALEVPLQQPVMLTAAAPEPVSAISQDLTPAVPPPARRAGPVRGGDPLFLQAQIKSLLLQIADLHSQLNGRANEIDMLHTAVERLQKENGMLRRKIDGNNA